MDLIVHLAVAVLHQFQLIEVLKYIQYLQVENQSISIPVSKLHLHIQIVHI